MGNTILRFFIILSFSFIFYIYSSGIAYLDSDTESVADITDLRSSEEERSGHEGRPDTNLVSGAETSIPLARSDINVVSENEETSRMSQRGISRQDVLPGNQNLPEGTPRNQLSIKDQMEMQRLATEIKQHQMILANEAKFTSRDPDTEISSASSAAKPKEYISEADLADMKRIADYRERAQKEILELTRQLEEIRLKELPTDTGQHLKKRVYESED